MCGALWGGREKRREDEEVEAAVENTVDAVPSRPERRVKGSDRVAKKLSRRDGWVGNGGFARGGGPAIVRTMTGATRGG